MDRREDALKRLGLSDEEIRQVIADDKAIDQGKSMDWDLSEEEHKQAMKMANAGTRKKPTAYNFDTTNRKRKENPTKANVVKAIAEMLEGIGENVNITNPERMVSFTIGEDSFEVTLIQKRKPK